MKKTCKFCSVQVVTYVELEASPFFSCAALMSLIIFGFLSLIILPVAYLLTQSAVHRCSRCLQTLGQKNCVGLPDDFNAPIWHFRLGKCSVVASRLYAIIGSIIFALLAGVYVYYSPMAYLHQNPVFHHNFESKDIDASWMEFLGDCGGEQILENAVHAKLQFNEKYENNLIHWTGYFAEAK